MAESEVNLRIPRLFEAPLSRIAALDENSFDALIEALGDLPVSHLMADAAENVADAVKELDGREARMILDFAVQTRGLAPRLGVENEVITAAVVSAFKKQPDPETLSNRVDALLGHPFVALRQKVLSLAHEPEPRLDQIRCLTDLRPVFSVDGTTDDVLGFLVVNTLTVEMQKAESEESLALSVDRKGLEALKAVAERALEKFDTLAATLEETGLVDLTIGAGRDE